MTDHPSNYWPGSFILNFIELERNGALRVTWNWLIFAFSGIEPQIAYITFRSFTGHLSKFLIGSMLLNFCGRARTSTFSITWSYVHRLVKLLGHLILNGYLQWNNHINLPPPTKLNGLQPCCTYHFNCCYYYYYFISNPYLNQRKKNRQTAENSWTFSNLGL